MLLEVVVGVVLAAVAGFGARDEHGEDGEGGEHDEEKPGGEGDLNHGAPAAR